jgi:hypothetical protein
MKWIMGAILTAIFFPVAKMVKLICERGVF